MNDDELSVRLEWPERSNEPFRPAIDQTDAGAPAADAAVARLARTVAELRSEVAELRAEVLRLRRAAEPPRPVESDAESGVQRSADARPISVRSRSRRPR